MLRFLAILPSAKSLPSADPHFPYVRVVYDIVDTDDLRGIVDVFDCWVGVSWGRKSIAFALDFTEA